MTELLDQSEVSTLLTTVANGGVRRTPAAVGAAADDCQHPARFSKAQMLALQALHEAFARELAAALAGELRTAIQVSLARIEQTTYDQFIQPLPNPTHLYLLQADQFNGTLCLDISPGIIFPIIDRLLGGNEPQAFIPQRPLTPIEISLVRGITDQITRQLSQAWSKVTPVSLQVAELASNPQMVRIMPGPAAVVVVVVELKLGNRAGSMSLCIPDAAIAPMMALVSAAGPAALPPSDDIPLSMRALLAATTIKRNELLSLAVGDIITTETSVAEDVLMQIEGKEQLRGRLVQFRGKRAVQITHQLESLK